MTKRRERSEEGKVGVIGKKTVENFIPRIRHSVSLGVWFL